MPHLKRPAERTLTAGLVDTTRWDAFVPRDGDIVVTAPPKSGTTWTQSILAMLISGDPGVDADTTMRSPWIDFAVRDLSEVMARLAAQTHRRQVKSHAPLDHLPIWEGLRYVTVYRHPIDVHFSFRAHERNYRPGTIASVYPDDIEDSFALFLRGAHTVEASLVQIVEHFRATQALTAWEGLLRLHYADMTRDRAGHVARIADHLDLAQPRDVMDAIVAASGFTAMQAHATRFAPAIGSGLWKDEAAFFHSGTSAKWKGRLSAASLAAYEDRLADLLPDPAERAWLQWGAAGRQPAPAA